MHPHQRAIHMDGTRRVVAGALHPDGEIALEEAANWPYPIKGYRSYDEMIHAHCHSDDEQDRLDYVLIVTPNFVHFDPAIKAIQAGIPVFCEKPLCLNLEEADALVAAATDKGIPFAVAHTYLGHWTTQLSRYIIRSGLLGEVRWVDSHYLQGWLASKIEATGQQQASWRVDPKKSGGSGCGGDIGTHALMQLRYVTGLEVTDLCAHMETFVDGRALDDHMTVYCRLSNGGKGMVRASQISIGAKNDLGITVVGSKGSLIWKQEEPEKIIVQLPNQPDRVYWRGAVTAGDGFLPAEMPEWLLNEPTIPSGHPEGFHDAFARLHRWFEGDVRKWQLGEAMQWDSVPYATVHDGWLGIAFLDACVKSHANGNSWVSLPI